VKSQLASDTADAQVHVVILGSGEEAYARLTKFANTAKLTGASLTAIGAFEKRRSAGSILPPKITGRSKSPSSARC
jgi:hypothetical protein